MSKDPCRHWIDALGEFPLQSLPEVRFRKFLLSLCVGSLFCLHGVGVFDEAKPPTPDTGRLCLYTYPLKPLLLSLMIAFLPSAGINVHHTSAA
jgi:hypothetical protein